VTNTRSSLVSNDTQDLHICELLQARPVDGIEHTELKALEEENAKLKKLRAEQMLKSSNQVASTGKGKVSSIANTGYSGW
jgi:hypothetical protein